MNFNKKFIYFGFDKITLNEKIKKVLHGLPCEWEKLTETTIKPENKCFGIATGYKSNLTIIDIDNKNSYELLIKKYPELKTFYTVATKKGFHIYCYYDSNVKSSTNCFKNYENIDILNDNKFVIAPPTEYIHNDITYSYKFIGGKIQPFPKALYTEIKPNDKTAKTEPKTGYKEEIIKDNFIYDITTTELKEILNKLDVEYLGKYSHWLKVLTVCKSLKPSINDVYKIFDEWSQQNKAKYDEELNLMFWNSNKGDININYLINVINTTITDKKQHLNLIPFYQPVDKVLMPDNIDKLEFTKKHLEYETEIFEKYKTIIIESTTGTGKTTNTAKQTKQYLDKHPEIKFLSIVNLIKLNEQQIKTFNDEGLNLMNYQDTAAHTLKNANVICCLNSIVYKLSEIKDIENYIIYIDEISSLIDSLLFNDNLNCNLKNTYLMLIKFINKCHKLILSDAFITQNVFNFIGKRTHKTIFIKNNFKKYQDVEAIHYEDETEFLNTMKENIKNNKYFLSASDSRGDIEKYLKLLLLDETIKLKEENFIIITSKTNISITDANKQFKNKWVFYSPAITTGVNFSIFDKQDVFIHIKGNTLKPADSFQQSTRTRNIKTLHFYSPVVSKPPVFNNKITLEKYFKERINTFERVANIAININDNEEEELNTNNIFYKMFITAKYQQNQEQTNKLLHFKKILKNEGFKISVVGKKNKINKELKTKVNKELKAEFSEFIDKFIDDIINENPNLYEIPEYKQYIKRIEYLQIELEDLKQYKYIIENEFKFGSFFTFLKVFQKSEKLKENLISSQNMDIKKIEQAENKILLVRNFEKQYNITPFNFDMKDIKMDGMSDENFKLIKTTFRTSKSKPKTIKEVKELYYIMLKQIFNNFDVIQNRQVRDEQNVKIMSYSINKELVEQLFKLIFKFQNNFEYLDIDKIKQIGVEPPIINNEPVYLFGKDK